MSALFLLIADDDELLLIRNMPSMFTFSYLYSSSTVTSSILVNPIFPALFIRISTVPNFSNTCP